MGESIMFVGMLNAFNSGNRTGTRIRAYKSFGIFTIGAATLDEIVNELYTRIKITQVLPTEFSCPDFYLTSQLFPFISILIFSIILFTSSSVRVLFMDWNTILKA